MPSKAKVISTIMIVFVISGSKALNTSKLMIMSHAYINVVYYSCPLVVHTWKVYVLVYTIT